MRSFRSEKLAEAGGVGVETVRYYQRRGLMTTSARGGEGGAPGIRRYDADDVRRLKFIRSAQASGFTLEEIAELLELEQSDDRARSAASSPAHRGARRQDCPDA